MSYVKTDWKDRIVEYPNRYKDQNGNILELTQEPGNVVEEGTLVDADKLNNLENGVEDLYGKVNGIKPTTISDLFIQATTAEEALKLSGQNPNAIYYVLEDEGA